MFLCQLSHGFAPRRGGTARWRDALVRKSMADCCHPLQIHPQASKADKQRTAVLTSSSSYLPAFATTTRRPATGALALTVLESIILPNVRDTEKGEQGARVNTRCALSLFIAVCMGCSALPSGSMHRAHGPALDAAPRAPPQAAAAAVTHAFVAYRWLQPRKRSCLALA